MRLNPAEERRYEQLRRRRRPTPQLDSSLEDLMMVKLLKARTVSWLVLLMSFTTNSGMAQVCANCPSFVKDPPMAVKNLASLAGCWVGKGPNGLGAKVSYELG